MQVSLPNWIYRVLSPSGRVHRCRGEKFFAPTLYFYFVPLSSFASVPLSSFARVLAAFCARLFRSDLLILRAAFFAARLRFGSFFFLAFMRHFFRSAVIFRFCPAIIFRFCPAKNGLMQVSLPNWICP